jgi:tetratricopeptide (TPR) repeat protein
VTDWTIRVAELRDLADDALTRDEHEEALARIAEAFTIVDAEGNQQHVVFASLLCIAADLAVVSDELESARSLYQRAFQVGSATQADGALIAKALVGVGSLLEAGGETAKAADYYRNALEALKTSTHVDAEVAGAAIRDAIERTSP